MPVRLGTIRPSSVLPSQVRFWVWQHGTRLKKTQPLCGRNTSDNGPPEDTATAAPAARRERKIPTSAFKAGCGWSRHVPAGVATQMSTPPAKSRPTAARQLRVSRASVPSVDGRRPRFIVLPVELYRAGICFASSGHLMRSDWAKTVVLSLSLLTGSCWSIPSVCCVSQGQDPPIESPPARCLSVVSGGGC